MSDRKAISTPDAPQAIGPYSQAIRVGSLLFSSGQIPLDPKTQQLVTGDIKVQTEQVCKNLEGVLKAADLNFSHVVKTTCFLKDMNDFQAFNEVFEKYFGKTKPARSTVQVARLPKDVAVEIDLIAAY